MGGTIVVANDTGRALRRKCSDVRLADVLDCAGGFRAGDTIYVTFRGVDGGQYVIATGIVRCDEGTLRHMLARAREHLPLDDRSNTSFDIHVVILERDVKLLWPTSKND